VTVTDHAGTIDQAVNASAEKLLRAIDAKFGKLRDKSLRAASRPVAAEEPSEESSED
jgi:hypothetical protein